MFQDFLNEEQISDRLRIEINRAISGFRFGMHRSVLSGEGVEFRSIRPYDPAGDSLAQIDWATSARLFPDGFSFVSKTFYPEREISVICAVEDCPSMNVPERKKEHAATLAWLFALSAFQYRDPFRFVSFSSKGVKTTGWSRNEELLLASAVEKVQRNLFSYLLDIRLSNTLLVVISDFSSHWDEEYIKKLRHLNIQKQNIHCLFIALDEWDGFEPVSHSVTLKDPQSKKTKVFDLRKGGEAEREANAQKKRFAELKKSVRPLGVSFISLPLIADDPLGGIKKQLLKLGFE